MITIKEFEDYKNDIIKSYLDDSTGLTGWLSYDEQMNIGVKFKQLPKSLRNWGKLVKELNLNCTGDAFRKRVAKYLKQHPDLLTNVEEGESYREDFIEQQKVRDWYNAYRRDLREETRIENLKDEIRKASDKFSKIEWKIYCGDKYSYGKEAVLLLSDLHIGAICSNVRNEYDYQIAMERLAILSKEVTKHCRRNRVETLHVLNLGDMIHGIIHTNARIEAQMDVSEQIMIASELLSQFMSSISKAAPNITYRSVFDNHSRAIADKNQHIEKEQFSRLIDWFIRERLKDTPIQFKEDNIDGGVGKLRLENGKLILFAHGHQDNINSSWQNFVGMTREWVDYICLAHYHNPKEKSYNGSTIFVNGSIVGTESYAFSKRLFADPSQKLIIFEDKDLIDINIYLN